MKRPGESRNRNVEGNSEEYYTNSHPGKEDTRRENKLILRRKHGISKSTVIFLQRGQYYLKMEWVRK